ncbi:MAG TPA: aromatic aminobenezylarsenical efflux permease ArsG family transporter [Nitrospinota bacterium]|nr:aromatic aminobenezylarsenical efflux permease ArsG family transporter [Nitrospinota bacterium]
MNLMSFMEAMGTSKIPVIASFFLGLMTAISPCPLATNIASIAYISKRINDRRHTLLVGFIYTLGRMFTYIVIASLVVFIGLNIQAISLSLQRYGERIIGPFLIIMGLIMLDTFRINLFSGGGQLNSLKERLSKKGVFGGFFLGVVFALSFCPFSAVLFFGMLIPLSLKTGDPIILPSVFAFGTGLPVIIFSFILAYSVSKLANIVNRVQVFESWMRKVASLVFIIMGIYYSITQYLLR